MKRFLVGFMASILILTIVAGCGSTKQTTPTPAPAGEQKKESTTPTVDKIKKDGKLLVGTSPDYPPFESLDKENKVIGFDIDLMQAVADKLGVKLEVVQLGFDGLIAALSAKKFDIMAAGVSVTEDRKKTVDFSKPYLIGQDAIVMHKDATDKITKLEDLKGKKVAVQIGTVQADNVKKIEGITVKEYNLFTEAAAAVSSKQADAVYLHQVVATAFVNADKNLKIVGTIPASDTAYALRKDSADLTTVVNQVIDELQKSGKFDELVKKWFK